MVIILYTPIQIQKSRLAKQAAFLYESNNKNYRFENCLRRLALRKPTFFRSTERASLVTRPA